MQKRYTLLLALALLAGMLTPWWHDGAASTSSLAIPSGDPDEDRAARAEWRRRRLADPATGEIPAGISFLERQYAATLPRAADDRDGVPVWQSRGPWNVGGRTRALAVDVANPNRILAGGVSGGIWLSEDGGLTWSRRTPLNAHPGVVSVAQDTRPGHTDTWYYLSGEVYGTSASGGGAFYLGDGLFKSTDGGLTWAPVTSTAAGNPQSFSTFFQSGWRVITDPTAADDVVYMATLGAVYRSTNGGTSWTAVRGGSTAAYSYFTEIAITSTGVLYAALSSDGPQKGLWRSTDSGATWTNITPATGFPTAYDRVVIGINPNNENEVYFLGSTPGAGLQTFLFGREDWNSLWRYTYVSGNGSGAGGQWADLSANLPNTGTNYDRYNGQGGYDLVVKVQPGTNYVYLGGTNVYRSTDGFATPDNTAQIGGFKPGTDLPFNEFYPTHHSDQHDFVFHPTNPDVLFTASDGGVHRTDDATAADVTWTSLNWGYHTTQFYTAAIEHTLAGDETIIGGLQDNGNFLTSSGDPTASWHEVMIGDGGYNYIADGKAFYLQSFQRGVGWKLAKSQITAAGVTTAYQRIDPVAPNGGVNNYGFINPLAVDPNDKDILYLPAGRRLYRQNQLSALPLLNEWEPIATGWTLWPDTVVGATAEISAIAVSHANPAHRVYFGTADNKLYRIDNANTGTPAWQQLQTPAGGSSAYITCIAIDPDNADDVLLVYSNYSIYSLWRSLNGGQNWFKAGGNLETSFGGTGGGPSVRWVSILPFPDGTRKYFAGTSVGLFSADTVVQHLVTQPGTVWTLEGADVLGSAVVDYVDVRAVDGRVVAATHGNGTFAADFLPFSSTQEVVGPTVRVWPNPARDFVNFAVERAVNAEIRLFDGQGRLVRRQTLPLGTGQVRLDGLPAGMYSFDLQGKGLRRTGKVMVQGN